MQLGLDDKKIKEILLDESYVSKEDIAKAEKFASIHHNSILDYLLQEGILNKDLLGQAVAEFYQVPYSDLNSNQPLRELVLKIPEQIAKKFRAVIFSENTQKIIIATDNPTQKELVSELQKLFPTKEIVLTYSLPDDIEENFIYYQKTLESRFSKIIENQKRIAPEILDEIFTDAFNNYASDIHFEPQFKEVLIRFRIDGVLREVGRIPKEHYENILNRLKVQSQLRIDEHFAPQDGSLHFEKTRKIFDIRVSIVPTVQGEKAVLRILSTYTQGLALIDLGLLSKEQEVIKETTTKPFGMILVAGPTGSGKTTTLYAVLKILNEPDVNITTIEDPVEYKIQGVNQIQVKEEKGITFAKGLRSIVRQDPDIILVGEIRDIETAEIAVNAALTGHLLLSTFHANDAATVIPRLLDMKIEPFLLASTLDLIIAQRLVRKICEHCRHSIASTKKELEDKFKQVLYYFDRQKLTFFKSEGCNMCNNTGYKGRTAIFELIRVSPELQDLILKSPSSREIWKLVRKQGARSLFEDGIEKVKRGLTTIEELLRVAEPPEENMD